MNPLGQRSVRRLLIAASRSSSVGKLYARVVSSRAGPHEFGDQDDVVAFADQAGAEGVAQDVAAGEDAVEDDGQSSASDSWRLVGGRSGDEQIHVLDGDVGVDQTSAEPRPDLAGAR
ncbi:hypothetical protein [Krasilnikovia cinnamomea]|uniref:hypothetical protein n=1 Tax=Krasilnikovia cinnamomea TaxID=349313 RepID=UPI001A91073B|nr:hypothetical protein [Krasilnikovia cinnamomea]